MAIYGRDNFRYSVEISEPIGNMQCFIDRDMSLALPFLIQQYMGPDEVINEEPPVVITEMEEDAYLVESMDMDYGGAKTSWLSFPTIQLSISFMILKTVGWARVGSIMGQISPAHLAFICIY